MVISQRVPVPSSTRRREHRLLAQQLLFNPPLSCFFLFPPILGGNDIEHGTNISLVPENRFSCSPLSVGSRCNKDSSLLLETGGGAEQQQKTLIIRYCILFFFFTNIYFCDCHTADHARRPRRRGANPISALDLKRPSADVTPPQRGGLNETRQILFWRGVNTLELKCEEHKEKFRVGIRGDN